MIEPITVGKHKIPRYIYHLTTQKNYNSMLKDGFLKPSEDTFCRDGVFFFELINFFKRWKSHSDWGGTNLQMDLINQVKKHFSDGLVLLKIPTENLNHEKLKIRSQNRLFSWFYKNECAVDKIKNSETNRANKFLRVKKLLYSTTTEQCANHICEGSSAQDSSLFKKRKEAIEYIYQDNIPIDKVEKLGEIEAYLIRFFIRDKKENPIKNIFLELLKGYNEQKGAELLK